MRSLVVATTRSHTRRFVVAIESTASYTVVHSPPQAADSVRDHPGEIHRLEDLRGIKFVGVFRNRAQSSLSLSHVGKTMTQILEPLFDIPHALGPAFVAPPPPAAPVQVPNVIPIEWLNSWSVVDWLQSIKLSQCAQALSGPARTNGHRCGAIHSEWLRSVCLREGPHQRGPRHHWSEATGPQEGSSRFLLFS